MAMRITFLNSLYPPHGAAGAENTLRLLAGAFAAHGNTCSVITLTPNSEPEIGEIDGVAVHYIPLANVYWPHGGRRPATLRPLFQAIEAYNPVMQARVASVLRSLRPDVLNCHNLQGFSAAAWLAAARLDIPVVQTLHDYYTACARSSMWLPARGNCALPCTECRVVATPRRALSRIPAAVTCVSHRLFDRLTAAGAFPRAREGTQPVRIIRGNNAASASFSEMPRRDGLTLGFMGRIEVSKGLDTLIAAIENLAPGLLTLRIAGNTDNAYARSLMTATAGRADVQFVGYARPADFFPSIDCLVIPSSWEDPFPRVFHEALAFGTPSLVTPLGGLPEAVRPGQTGFIARGSDADALRGAVSALLSPGWDRDAVRAACFAEAENYAPDRIFAQYESVLRAAATRGTVPEDAGEVWHLRNVSPKLCNLEEARHGA
jgi:glycosyltransferase involved in cell wall biosynthesis